jgi:hypothetical protein
LRAARENSAVQESRDADKPPQKADDPQQVGAAADPSRDTLVVKLRGGSRLPYEDRVERQLPAGAAERWSQLKQRFGEISLLRLFRRFDPDAIRALVTEAADSDPTYTRPSFLTYYVVDAPKGTDLNALAEALRDWKEMFETAYIDRDTPDPVIFISDDPFCRRQTYLDPAPWGVDARAAWNIRGGGGEGEHLVDVERGWELRHRDLHDRGVVGPISGMNRPESASHGTCVLGVACGLSNGEGIVGIAPRVSAVTIASYWKTDGQKESQFFPEAVLAAIERRDRPSVLLIEAQASDGTHYVPREFLPADYEAIRTATALGIVVVEAGGNGGAIGALRGRDGVDLDELRVEGRRVFDPDDPDFRDSGAILVSASGVDHPYRRSPWAPHGKRIDVFAHGEQVFTSNWDSQRQESTWDATFGGTSAAAAITAGVCLLVQGVAAAKTGSRLSPKDLRALISDRERGTLPAPGERIGVMPDLRKILPRFGIRPGPIWRDGRWFLAGLRQGILAGRMRRAQSLAKRELAGVVIGLFVGLLVGLFLGLFTVLSRP